jgi:hypothetical protein
MNISIAQLMVGFQSSLTDYGLAEQLGVPVQEVRARLMALTPDEESAINQAMSLEGQ